MTSISNRKLSKQFYRRDTVTVAQELLGKMLVVKALQGVKKGIIVETEAYRGIEDKACHGSWRKRESCQNLWKKGGITYVYLTYGMHWMLNIVTEDQEIPSAVLIRALEPISNIDFSTKGPGRLTKALGITGKDDGKDLTFNEIYTTSGLEEGFKIKKAKRIGVDYAGRWRNKLWRFYIKDNWYVSRA